MIQTHSMWYSQTNESNPEQFASKIFSYFTVHDQQGNQIITHSTKIFCGSDGVWDDFESLLIQEIQCES